MTDRHLIDDNDIKLRTQWQELNSQISRSQNREKTLRAAVPAGGSARRRLIVQLRIMVAVAYVCAVIFSPINCVSSIPMMAKVCMSLFFVIMGTLKLLLMVRLTNLNLAALSVNGALKQVIGLRRMRRNFLVIGMVLAMPVLAMLFAWSFAEGRYAVAGAVVGAVVGAAIGWMIDRRARKALREMQAELDDCNDCL